MVSVGPWSNETTYPFQSMKKVVSSDGNKFTVSSSEHYNFSQDHIETEADFFVIPDHVTAYFNGFPNQLDFLWSDKSITMFFCLNVKIIKLKEKCFVELNNNIIKEIF